MPSSLKPMLATSAPELPIGDPWTYEVKWDGYRLLAVKDGDRVRLVSRNQKDLTRDYPGVVAAVASLPAKKGRVIGVVREMSRASCRPPQFGSPVRRSRCATEPAKNVDPSGISLL